MRLHHLLPIVVALALTRSSLAHADASSSASSSKAMQLYEAGQEAAAKEDWERARTFFASAFRLTPHYQIAANLARTEYKLGKMRDATEHFAFCINHAPLDLPEADYHLIKKIFVSARAHVGTLSFSSLSVGTEVLVDGVLVGKAPLEGEIFVEPGKRGIELRRPGYATARSEKMVAAGERVTIDMPLVPTGEEQPVAPSPASSRAGALAKKDPPEQAGPQTSVIALGAASSAVALGLGIGFAWWADELWDMQCTQELKYCEKDVEYIRRKGKSRRWEPENERASFAGLSVGSFIAAGALGLATAGYAIFAPRKKPSPLGKVGVVAGPQGAGVTWSWIY